MSLVLPFRAIRPSNEFVSQVASLPYDVMTKEEGQKAVGGNPLSFLYVEKSEIDVPEGTKSDDRLIYEKAKENFIKMRDNKIFKQDEKPLYYIYRQQMGSQVQTGIVGLVSVAEYEAGKIKKHELTRKDKEKDRICHIQAVNAQTGPVFIAYRSMPAINEVVEETVKGNAEYDFTADDGVVHKVWIVSEPKALENIRKSFLAVKALYIADGHHRAAAAVEVARLKRKKRNVPNEIREYDSFMAVLFPHNQLKVMDYNRAVKDLNSLTEEKFLKKIGINFEIRDNFKEKSPQKPHEFGMYLRGKWYQLTPQKGIYDGTDPIASLDATILQSTLLSPVLGIDDPRTDQRIKFVGGIRGMAELEKLVDKEGYAVAFSLYPTTLEQIMKVADVGKIMPPKSTWFEPKLRSGIFIHDLGE
ncbi:MAG: DUF1015 family protein [Smithellaceae bacterium]